MKDKKKIVIATRKSALSIAQADIVKKKLLSLGIESEYLFINTKGDRDKKSPLYKIGGNGLFVRGLEKSLLSGDADIAVHSAKDLPFELSDGLLIAALPDADDFRDILLLNKGTEIEKINDPVIGTSSPRRLEQIKRIYKDAAFKNLRGNLTTRIEKLRENEYDGIIVSLAGLNRLNIPLSDFSYRIFDLDEMIPAACQGIIAVECKNDHPLIHEFKKLDSAKIRLRFENEREIFKKEGASCNKAFGVYFDIKESRVYIYKNGKVSYGQSISSRSGK